MLKNVDFKVAKILQSFNKVIEHKYMYIYIICKSTVFRCFTVFRYKHVIDPTVEVVKKLCISLRKNAKDERVLFHFNGHGVPRPTDAGEIWVFNKNITQVIKIFIYLKCLICCLIVNLKKI